MAPNKRSTPLRPMPAALTDTGKQRAIEQATAAAEEAAAVTKDIAGEVTNKLNTLVDLLEDQKQAEELREHIRDLVAGMLSNHWVTCPLSARIKTMEDKMDALEKTKDELAAMIRGALKVLVLIGALLTFGGTVAHLAISWLDHAQRATATSHIQAQP